MAAVTPVMIKELRERTQAGMSDCKVALVEAAGDLDKAVEIILKKGIVKAAARAGRIAAEGEVRTLVVGRRGTIVEVNCQTDFVARGDDFRKFVGEVLSVASTLAPGTDLGGQKVTGTSRTVEELRQERVAKSGENMVVRRWDAVEAKGAGAIVHSYIHMGGKLAVLLVASAPTGDAAKHPDFLKFVDDCAMQIAAMSPLVVAKGDLAERDVAKQREIFDAQMKEEKAAGKLRAPEQAWPKILDGKIAKWFTEVTLLGQDSVVTPGSTVDKLRLELGKQLGGEVRLEKFVRFALGEGIVRKTEDLAAEVAKIAGG